MLKDCWAVSILWLWWESFMESCLHMAYRLFSSRDLFLLWRRFFQSRLIAPCGFLFPRNVMQGLWFPEAHWNQEGKAQHVQYLGSPGRWHSEPSCTCKYTFWKDTQRRDWSKESYKIYFLMINKHYFVIKIVEIKLNTINLSPASLQFHFNQV